MSVNTVLSLQGSQQNPPKMFSDISLTNPEFPDSSRNKILVDYPQFPDIFVWKYFQTLTYMSGNNSRH